MFVLIGLLVIAVSSVSNGATTSGSGTTTRYWDCCKPSCAWSGKASVNSTVQTCIAGGVTADNTANDQSGGTCGQSAAAGQSYMCAAEQPWNISSTMSYGFAAAYISGDSESDW